MVRAWVVTLHLYHVYVSWAFQCPHGLELLLIWNSQSGYWCCFNALTGLSCYALAGGIALSSTAFQCPLGLIPHFYVQHRSCNNRSRYGVNALSGLYLITTVPLQKPRFYAVSRTCFCRYLSEYSDNSRFSCMLTFWTYLMRCTYPWHWIKYSTNYNRCHPIFHSLDKLSWTVTRYPLVLLLSLLCAKCKLLFIELL